MTKVLKPDVDMVKLFHHTKNEVPMSTASKVIAQIDTHKLPDRHTNTHTLQKYAGGNKFNIEL